MQIDTTVKLNIFLHTLTASGKPFISIYSLILLYSASWLRVPDAICVFSCSGILWTKSLKLMLQTCSGLNALFLKTICVTTVPVYVAFPVSKHFLYFLFLEIFFSLISLFFIPILQQFWICLSNIRNTNAKQCCLKQDQYVILSIIFENRLTKIEIARQFGEFGKIVRSVHDTTFAEQKKQISWYIPPVNNGSRTCSQKSFIRTLPQAWRTPHICLEIWLPPVPTARTFKS